jgi:hypothetical protein
MIVYHLCWIQLALNSVLTAGGAGCEKEEENGTRLHGNGAQLLADAERLECVRARKPIYF